VNNDINAETKFFNLLLLLLPISTLKLGDLHLLQDIHISKTEKLFAEMKMNGEDDPVETLTSVLELERTLRNSAVNLVQP
jgi:hypothetical protein